MKKRSLLALIFLFVLGAWVVYPHLSPKTHNGPRPTLTYGYVGYAFVEANTTLEFHGMLAEKDLGPGFSISISGIPKGITQKTEIDTRPCPTPFNSNGFECRDVVLFITPTATGRYDLSNVTVTVSSKFRSISAKLGEVKLEVKGRDEGDLKPVYYPYAGTYLSTMPLNASPTDLDVPNVTKARAVPQYGLPIKPGKIVAIIVPLKVEFPAQNAVFALKFEVKNERTGKLEEVPGIPYYVLS